MEIIQQYSDSIKVSFLNNNLHHLLPFTMSTYPNAQLILVALCVCVSEYPLIYEFIYKSTLSFTGHMGKRA